MEALLPLPTVTPLKKSSVRIRVSPSLSEIHHPWILLLLFLAVLSSTVPTSSLAEISYADHCNSTVPESTPGGSYDVSYRSFQLVNGYFSGGDKILRQNTDPNPSSSSSSSSGSFLPRFFYFSAQSLRRTRTPGVLHVEGTLTLQYEGIRMNRSLLRRSRRRNYSRSFIRRKEVSFDLSGFWSKSAGKLCMVGPGFTQSKGGNPLSLSAAFKLNYPMVSTISTSLAAGTVESLDANGSSNHFDLISVLVYAQQNYEYTKLPKSKESCSHLDIHEQSLRFDSSESCSYFRSYRTGLFKLEYGSNCSGSNCGPFDKALGFSPSFMSLNQIQCSEDGRLHLYMAFPGRRYFGHDDILVPQKSLVAEGFWDSKVNRLCLVACPILNIKDSLSNVAAGECTIGFSMWFPAVLSIKKRSTAVGRIWSNRDKSDPAYFSMISFRSLESDLEIAPGLKYEYTEMDEVKKSCSKSILPSSGKKRYPDGNSVGDLGFYITVTSAEGNSTWVSATPLSVGESFYVPNPYTIMNSGASMPPPTIGELNHSVWNVSYRLRFSFLNASSDVTEPTEISAEGIYNAGTGVLCMVGCQYLSSSLLTKQAKSVDSMDCGILINVQFASLNPEAAEQINGTIRSTRLKSDPLYFKPLEGSLYMMYATQASESIWRMDIEITMVIISLTLSCIFIGLQLFHVKKKPDVLPSISITMLVILSLGHMIPLVLNFEALFFMHNRQNVLSWSGGWLEVNEVVVRVMTMVAFLLQFRFLQRAWSARSAEEPKKGLWITERKTLKLCLPLYFAGGLIAWFVHLRSNKPELQRSDFSAGYYHSLWEDLLSYAGLILDGFLLPQVILNIFWNSKDMALAPIFYFGTTIVRAMPHLYDAYRAGHYTPYFNSSYIYASPDGDFFSTAWDIIVPCEGLLFAVIIYLQQRFGGSCILPPRFRKPGGYETVPVVSL